MDAAGFLRRRRRHAGLVRALADALAAGRAGRVAEPLLTGVDAVLLLGMGSSAYAAGVVAARLRARGVRAVAELASSAAAAAADPRLLVVAVSAGGSSAETVAAAARYAGVAPPRRGDRGRGLAGRRRRRRRGRRCSPAPEPGGVACRSYRHTLAVLLALADQLAPARRPTWPASCRRRGRRDRAPARRRARWVPEVADLLDGPDGCWVVAPAARLARPSSRR